MKAFYDLYRRSICKTWATVHSDKVNNECLQLWTFNPSLSLSIQTIFPLDMVSQSERKKNKYCRRSRAPFQP